MWNPFGPPSLDGFVKLILRKLGQAGKPTDYVYDREEQTLVRGTAIMSLANVYASYCHAKRAQRPAILNNYLEAMTAGEHPAGDSFEAVRGQLIAAVREEILLSSVRYFLAADQPASQALTARAPLSRWYARTLVLDHP